MPLLSHLLHLPKMSTPVPLSAIPTLTNLYATHKLQPPSNPPTSTPNAHLNSRISLLRTDITTLHIDCIVNAANDSLLGGGGVDGAIHRAAGRQLVRECERLYPNGCETGDAKVTAAFELPCKKVIHAVGPIYKTEERKARGRAARLLKRCYTRSLDLMVQEGCGSLAFSCLSTGVYGYPSDEAAEVAVGAVREWLDADERRAGGVERVVFCCFLEKDERAYQEVLP